MTSNPYKYFTLLTDSIFPKSVQAKPTTSRII